MQRINLSGTWEFCLDADRQGVRQKFFERHFTDTIKLPGTTAEACKGSRNREQEVMHLTEYYPFEGDAWYRKEIAIDKLKPGQSCFLRLERTRISSVWLEDIFVGTQESLVAAHWYDLTDAVIMCAERNRQKNAEDPVLRGQEKKQKYRLTIRISNIGYKAPGGHLTSPDTQTNWNGILGDISLYFYQTARIADAQIFASAENRKLDVRLAVTNFGEAVEEELFAECSPYRQAENPDIDRFSQLFEEKRAVKLQKGENQIEWSIPIPEEKEIALWSEYTPFLYQVTICVKTKNPSNAEEAAGSGDTVTVTIGFRDLHTSESSFYLNDLQIFLRGKHDGMVFPLTGYAPMDAEAWKQYFHTAKEYGINHYRFHTCCPPEAAFAAADELGIYLEPEVPFWGTVAEPGEAEYDEARQKYLIEEGYRILREFGNHPSFLLFSLGNELWGSAKELNRILHLYKETDRRHWYTQGSNNFQFTPIILEEEDFFCGVRFAKDRLFRGSYAMCDAPQGHVQVLEPENTYSYDKVFAPDAVPVEAAEGGAEDGTVEIQYQTGTKKVKASEKTEPLIAKIPVVSHEIGQYETYPDFREIERYTGVLGAENLKIFRKRLEDVGMLHKAIDFFEASGALAVSCYKRELETAFRSRRLSGFQILDLQDFPGQGTSLVGILNAFMESKGLIEPEEWRQFCSDRVLMLQFSGYVYEAGADFSYRALFYYNDPCPIRDARLQITLEEYRADDMADAWERIAQQTIPVGDLKMTRLSCLQEGNLTLPKKDKPQKYRVSVEICGTTIGNQYEIYAYPCIQKRQSDQVVVTNKKEEMLFHLKQGKRVLYLGGTLQEDRRIEGTYCTNFWNYPMFASISESMGKKKPIGTMGLCIERTHPAFQKFPTESHTTPQWWKIVTQTQLAVLDGMEIEPIVWMIDNFGRNHKIGLLFEAKVGAGSLLACQKDLLCGTALEENWLYESLLSYAESEAFAPEKMLTEEELARLYG
ncbi:MAG: hypothetical protein NC302_05260 [Bacteroidales bacterium]|nr:hypothetical protein [Bacteroidales bacterium]MCM1417010.1 beta-glucuronidase [bacterium]MCM1423394.1 beta-glucuronidase [bacterium]